MSEPSEERTKLLSDLFGIMTMGLEDAAQLAVSGQSRSPKQIHRDIAESILSKLQHCTTLADAVVQLTDQK